MVKSKSKSKSGGEGLLRVSREVWYGVALEETVKEGDGVQGVGDGRWAMGDGR
jgi:hypothetical protein